MSVGNEKTPTPNSQIRELPKVSPSPEEKESAHSNGDHGGIYSRMREAVAAGGAQEPPPPSLAPIFRSAEFSHPVNDAQKARALQTLQQNYGNRYVQRVLAGEGEISAGHANPLLIQRAESQAGPESEAPTASLGHSSGRALDQATQDSMGSSLNHDFSGVRVHDDSTAHQAAKGLNAAAFTTGRDVYFSQGAYNPGSDSGRKLLAHELTHVVQQSQGATGVSPSGFSVSHPSDPLERQADQVSEAVMRGEMFPPISTSLTPVVHRAAPAAPAPSHTPPSGTPAPASASGTGGRSTAAGGSTVGTTPAARAGDFTFNAAGIPVVIPLRSWLERQVPGNIPIPDSYLKKAAFPGFKLTSATIDLDENKIPSGATIGVGLAVPPLTGDGTLTVDRNRNASGTVHVVFSPQKMPGLKQTTVDARITKDEFSFSASVDFDLPKVTGNLQYKYQDHKHSGKGKANYQGSKMRGSIEIIMSEAGLISGSGMLDMELFKGLQGQANVAVDEKRNIAVQGRLTVPGEVVLFPEKKYEKSFFNFEKKFPIWGITIPVIDVNVGIFAEIHAGAGFRSKFGPGVLRGIELTGEFGTDPEAATEFGLGGEFYVPAAAEVVANVGGGIGLGLAVADITGGIEAIGVAGLYTALTVRPQFKYAGGKYTISGMAELAGVAQLKFGINAFAKIDVGVWLFKGTVWRKDWTLAEWVWNTGLNIALRANISYTLGDDFAPEISFETGQVDPEKFIKDAMPESGSPVPAPPKPPVPERSSFTAEGAAGGAAGGAPGEAPAAPTPGAAPAQTTPGGPGGAVVGPPGTQPPGADSPEHTKQVQDGLKAIDDEQALYAKNGQILKSEAEQVTAKVKKNHPVFKSLTVVDGAKSWDYDYVASPGNKKVGLTKEEATQILESYDVRLNAGVVEGDFSKFDFGGYNFTTAPPIHPANVQYSHPQGPAIPRPGGPFRIQGTTPGGPNFRDWVDNVIGALREGKKSELRAIADAQPTADEKKQKVLEAMGLGADATWQSRKGSRSVDTIINQMGELHVERTYPGMSYPDLNLANWQEHHIHPVNWGGDETANSNLIFLRHGEHHPISTWFDARKRLLTQALSAT